MPTTYWDEMFNTQGESTSLADMQVASSTSTAQGYIAQAAGKLIKVVLVWAGEAATSLAEFVRVELKNTKWTPNLMKFGMSMAGLRTAPAFPIPDRAFDVEQPVDASQPTTGQYIYADAATPVTCNLRVFGQFVAF